MPTKMSQMEQLSDVFDDCTNILDQIMSKRKTTNDARVMRDVAEVEIEAFVVAESKMRAMFPAIKDSLEMQEESLMMFWTIPCA